MGILWLLCTVQTTWSSLKLPRLTGPWLCCCSVRVATCKVRAREPVHLLATGHFRRKAGMGYLEPTFYCANNHIQGASKHPLSASAKAIFGVRGRWGAQVGCCMLRSFPEPSASSGCAQKPAWSMTLGRQHIIPCVGDLVISCEVFCEPSYEWWMAPKKPVLCCFVRAPAQLRKKINK